MLLLSILYDKKPLTIVIDISGYITHYNWRLLGPVWAETSQSALLHNFCGSQYRSRIADRLRSSIGTTLFTKCW